MRSLISLTFILVLVLVLPADFTQAKEDNRLEKDGERDNLGIFVFDGSGVHDIGELLLHTGNWGIMGSYPGSSMPISQFPSAEWPAGSGVEHLYVEALWVGAIKSGVPAVSTAAFEIEFSPTDDAIDIIYNSYEGAPGGKRLPSPGADDDGDGMMDEDWLDGHDNDGDGLIDEDFAAISPQMFSSWYTDNMPGITDRYPEHNPLDIMVRQETYQWDDDEFDDFVGVKFTVTNTGDEVLEDVCLGIFTDGDAGRRNEQGYYLEDASGSWRGMRDSGDGEVYVDLGYVYDFDGDGGRTTSYYGTMILGTSEAPSMSTVPGRAEWTAYRISNANPPFGNPPYPGNDFERYEVLSTARHSRNMTHYFDVRYICGTGTFAELQPGESIEFHIANVCGDGLEGLLDNAARCKRLFNGITYAHNGEETQVHWTLDEPPLAGVIDIKPGTCKNPFNIKNFEFIASRNPNAGGKMPVAILGSDRFDVTEIDISTVRLNGAAPLRRGQSFSDIAGPGESEGPCHCAEEGPDGYTDLLLKFSNQQIVPKRIILSIPVPGEVCTMLMTGEFFDGTAFQMSDCVTLVGEPPRFDKPDRPMLTGETRLMGASPNPFNPVTTIAFELAIPGEVSITVYDVSGRMIRSLVKGHLSSGVHEVTWNGRDRNGATAASGVYFYRLMAGDVQETRKMVLLR